MLLAVRAAIALISAPKKSSPGGSFEPAPDCAPWEFSSMYRGWYVRLSAADG